MCSRSSRSRRCRQLAGADGCRCGIQHPHGSRRRADAASSRGWPISSGRPANESPNGSSNRPPDGPRGEPPFRARPRRQPGSACRARRSARALARPVGCRSRDLGVIEDDAVARGRAASGADRVARRDGWRICRRLVAPRLSCVGSSTASRHVANPGPDLRRKNNHRLPWSSARSGARCLILAATFEFLASVATRLPKVTIPSPSMLHLRGGRNGSRARSTRTSPSSGATSPRPSRVDPLRSRPSGCRYLQLDDVAFAYLCDPNGPARPVAANGDDPAGLPQTLRRDDQRSACRPARPDMTVTMHTCRGNFKQRVGRRGRLRVGCRGDVRRGCRRVLHGISTVKRSGTFEPLRLLPAPETVVLGLVTTKVGVLEDQATRSGAASTRRPPTCRSKAPVPVAAMRILEHAPRQRPAGR